MSDRRAPLRFLLLNSWKEEISEGTGTAVSISARGRGLRALGHEVRSVGLPPGTGPLLLRRLLFNVRLRLEGREDPWGGSETNGSGEAVVRPDVIVGFDVDGSLLVRSSRWRQGRSPLGAPFVQELKGVAADEARFATGPDRTQLLLLAALERRSARGADLVVVPSRYSAEVVRSLYGVAADRIAVVPEGIDLAAWIVPEWEAPAAADPVILSVARQYPRKNTVTLLRAHRLLLQRLPRARLRIVGGGPELPRLRQAAAELEIADRTAFLGPLRSGADVRREYARADCFCLPSLQEGFGLVYLEAMAAGVPIVTPDRGAPSEVVGEAGLAVDPTDATALSHALERAVTNVGLQERLAAAGRRRVRRFDLERVARGYERILLERLPELRDAAGVPGAGPAQACC